MSVKLNKQAVKHARELIKSGKVVRDEPGDWRDAQLAAKDETAWLKKHDWTEYGSWNFGVDPKASPETKGRYSFPMGDYTEAAPLGGDRDRVACGPERPSRHREGVEEAADA